MSDPKYETVIGLEVHVHLNTASKMFCGCSTQFGNAPNTQVCPVCLGFPGVLPVINNKALHLAIMTALALNCEIAKFTKFDRKHYFYPDLPKNFQISQYDKPLSYDGLLDINVNGEVRSIRLKRIHLEEDAGKLIHQEEGGVSMVDYNRAGIPLLEIVTQPDLRSPDEAYEFLTRVKTILEYLDVSNCNMEEGSLRCDANISVRPVGQAALGTKIELKNMNSFKGVKQALEYEVNRQIDLTTDGKVIIQETRLWNSEKLVTTPMRTKEEAHDYRYFPEPDLMPIMPSDKLIDEIKKGLPEMPNERRERFIVQYKLSEYDASILTKDKFLADLFEKTVAGFNQPKVVANWLTGSLLGTANEKGVSPKEINFTADDFITLFKMVEDGTASGKMAKEIFKRCVDTNEKPTIIFEKMGKQVTDELELLYIIKKVIISNPKAVEDYKSGKETAITFLVGQVMKETKGKASPRVLNTLLRKELKERQ